jgi:CYTH domain-containing protein
MIENELKFLLKSNMVLDLLTDKYPVDILHLKQGYLSKHARVRNILDFKTGILSYTFTYKILLPSGELEEFEQDINSDSFGRCFKMTDGEINKLRYSTKIDDEKWDLDIFVFDYDKSLILVMAECEMPEGRVAPKFIPDFISTNLVYAVPREDTELFTSRKLTDPKYVKTIIKRFCLDETPREN